jgi:two-component system, NtrC family, nitrogen regulation sensor histidine kinase NtrY
VSTRVIKIVAAVSFLLSITSFVVTKYSTQILTYQLASPPPISRVKHILMQRTEVGMQATMDLIDEAYDNSFESAFRLLSDSKWEILQDKGLAIFLFKDDKMHFWSENMDVNQLEEISNKLVWVQNTWCISYWIAREDIKGLLLVKLKYSYPYQNKFLQNDFHHTIDFLGDYTISPFTLNGSFPVALYGSNPIFYLTYIPRNFELEEENFTALYSRIGLSLMLFALYTILWLPFFRRRKALSTILLFVFFIGLRLASLYWNIFPQGSWKLFSIEIFAYSWLIPSLGDLLINSLIVFATVCYIFKYISNINFKSKLFRISFGVLFAFLSVLLFLVIDSLLSILIHNSTITLEAYRIITLTIYTIIEYLVISLWFVSFVLCLHSTAILLYDCKKRNLLAIWLLAFTALTLLWILLVSMPSALAIFVSVLIVFVLHRYYKQKKAINSNVFVFILLLFSIYTVISVSVNSVQKDRDIRKILALNLANERDPIAEVIFPQITRRMHADQEIINFLDKISNKEAELYGYLNENYLSGYLKKYDFQSTVCLTSSDLIIESSGEVLRCYDFFESMLNEYGERIPGTSFYHLNNQNGRISYLGMVEYVLPDGEEICIYLELDSKLSREVLGYPELLLDGKVKGRSALSNYSSAKYIDGQLIARTGEFNYPLVNKFNADTTSRYAFVDHNGYNHLMYSSDGDIQLLLSRPNENLFNITASFAWVFLFFYLTLIFWLALGGLPVGFNWGIPSLKNRIKYSMVQLIILSLIMVGMVTIAYSVKSFEQKNYDSLNEKLLSAKVDIEDNLVSQGLIDPDYSNYLTHYLVKLSNVLRSDINIYSNHGELIATSRPEVFDRQLIGTGMHPLSYFDLSVRHSPKLIHTEQIGKMEYMSAYAPLFNNRNQRVAYINLPYFTRQNEFIEEIFSVIVALVNIYALLILFAIFVAVAISNQISKPLELIRVKLSTINIGKHNETISYEANDELGQLITEYNRMVKELAESANKLAQSQRQSAWREMAKQIAHEIKNPLTPIKLNLQYLMRAKKKNQPDWDILFEKFADTLIDQIKVLSNIATEFSNFAKMPVGQFSNIQLNKVVDDSLSLFTAYPNITIEKEIPSKDIFVFADKEQLSRVFVNLIKNAVQAIGRKENGHIRVSVVCIDNQARVEIEDNGTGILPEVTEKLFTPNFTTKSGGMGLGLAISKGIVEVIGGKIWFDTNYGFGTKFFVQLPISNS